MRGNRIFLVGMTGSGKTYWGEKIAAHFGWKFLDLDKYIEGGEQMTITEIFENRGEDYFRRLETKYLKEVASIESIVVATGGGSACFHGNMEMMNKAGETYYLKVTPETIERRIKKERKDRPLFKGISENELLPFVIKLLKERQPFYNQSAHIVDAEVLNDEKMKQIFAIRS